MDIKICQENRDFNQLYILTVHWCKKGTNKKYSFGY